MREKRLIAAIINKAIEDALLYRNPNSHREKLLFLLRKRRKHKDGIDYIIDSPLYLSYEARRFLRASNKLFCQYCEYLDLDAAFLEEKITKELQLYDLGNSGIFRESFNKKRKKINSIHKLDPIDFLKVNM